MTSPTPHKVVFAPGVLESLEQEMSPAELQQMMDEIAIKLKDGTLFAESQVVDMDRLMINDPELYAVLERQLASMTNGPTIQ